MTAYGKGADVEWSWGDGFGGGKIKERYTEEVTKVIDGREVTLDATEGNPAYLIEREDGALALKRHNEIKPVR